MNVNAFLCVKGTAVPLRIWPGSFIIGILLMASVEIGWPEIGQCEYCGVLLSQPPFCCFVLGNQSCFLHHCIHVFCFFFFPQRCSSQYTSSCSGSTEPHSVGYVVLPAWYWLLMLQRSRCWLVQGTTFLNNLLRNNKFRQRFQEGSSMASGLAPSAWTPWGQPVVKPGRKFIFAVLCVYVVSI